MTRHTTSARSMFAGAFLALFIVSLLAGAIRWWSLSSTALIPGFYRWIFLALSLILLFRSKPRVVDLLFGICFGLPLFFLSDWLCRSYNLLQGPSIRGEIILCTLCAIPLLRRSSSWFYQWLTLIVIGLCIYALYAASGGSNISSDDHSTFFFRLNLLNKMFPSIPFYYPFWNAGWDARDFFATGALSFFLITKPLFLLLPLEFNYTAGVSFVVFVCTPLCTFWACRLLMLPSWKSALGSLVALSSSLLWYRWSLKYGTMGFVISSSLLPVVLAYTSRFLDKERETSLLDSLGLVASFTLMLFWSASGLTLIPAICVCALNLPGLCRKKWGLSSAAMILLLNIPWIVIFWNVSKVGSFLDADQSAAPTAQEEIIPAHSHSTFKHEKGSVDVRKSLEVLRHTSGSTNPLILLLGFPGILLFGRKARLIYGGTALWLLLLGTIAVPVKPQLELDRMLVMLGIVLAPPTAAAIGTLVTEAQGTLRRALVAVTLGFLFAGLLSTLQIARNRSVEQFSFRTSLAADLSQAIQAHARGGRVLFSGFMLHDLDNGHLAPLPILSGVPLLASSHVHNLWRYRQIFPEEYISRKDSGGIEEYLDLYNVSAVFAHEREWREYFLSHPEFYTRVWAEGKYHLFERANYTSNYFLKGKGTIDIQSVDAVRLRLSTTEAVIKFSYYPFLTAFGCAEVRPFSVSDSVQFVQLHDCNTAQDIVLTSIGPLDRVRGG